MEEYETVIARHKSVNNILRDGGKSHKMDIKGNKSK